MKFRDGPYRIRGGTDSSKNLLGFSGIDGTFDHGGIDGFFCTIFLLTETIGAVRIRTLRTQRPVPIVKG